MNPSSKRSSGFLLVLFLLTGTVVLVLLGFKYVAALQELRAQVEEMRTTLNARDEANAALRRELEQGRSTAAGPARIEIPGSSGSTVTTLEMQLALRLQELTRQQSNTAILIDKLLAKTAPEAPEQTAQRSEVTVKTLERTGDEMRQNLETVRRRTAELLVSLNVPADIATLEPAKALDTATLRPYWPFFEAKKERDFLDSVQERIYMRLLQEKIDAAAAR